MTRMDMQHQIEALRRQAVLLAGQPGDLVQRASVYHHLYRESGGNHVFPLLAAHGALWAAGYLRKGLAWGTLAAWLLSLAGLGGPARLAQLHGLADTFRDINRRVCVETWFIYQLTARPDLAAAAEQLVPAELHGLMMQCHAARRSGRRLGAGQRRALFAAFFHWEQAEIVGPAVERAFEAFAWKLVKRQALRPRIAFAYLPKPLAFADFRDTNERIEKGQAAFDAGERAGWIAVERSLEQYGIMPQLFARDPAAHYRQVIRTALRPAALRLAA